MTFMKTLLILLAAFLPMLCFGRLGETIEQCDARYGNHLDERPPRFPGSKTRRVYLIEVFRLDIEFNEEGKAWVLYYRKVPLIRQEELKNMRLYKERESDGKYYHKNDLWKDSEPFEKLDWTAATIKDFARVETEAKAIAAERDAHAIRAAEDIASVGVFFGAFYPGASISSSYDDEKVTGLAGMVYDIYQANAGTAEWRNNSDLEPMEPPADRSSTTYEAGVAKSRSYDPQVKRTYAVGRHRSDRQAFATNAKDGIAFWSRDADNALIAYGKKRKAEIEQWKQGLKSKF